MQLKSIISKTIELDNNWRSYAGSIEVAEMKSTGSWVDLYNPTKNKLIRCRSTHMVGTWFSFWTDIQNVNHRLELRANQRYFSVFGKFILK